MSGFDSKLLQKMYDELLCQQDTSKFHQYFTEDCYILINGKEFNAKTFKERMQWIKENCDRVQVKIIHSFTSQDGQWISDLHLTTFTSDGEEKKVMVMHHAKMAQGRICKFIDITCALEGDQAALYMVNAH